LCNLFVYGFICARYRIPCAVNPQDIQVSNMGTHEKEMREIPKSGFDLIWLSLSLFATCGIFYTVFLSLFEEPVGVGALLLALPGWFFCWLTLKLWRRVWRNAPALILHDKGLIFSSISPTVLPWHALREVYLGPIHVPQGRYRFGRHLLLRFEPGLMPVIRRLPESRPIFSWWLEQANCVWTLTACDVGIELREVRNLILAEWDRALKKADPAASVGKEEPLRLDETHGF
jgi:hypothetical protein